MTAKRRAALLTEWRSTVPGLRMGHEMACETLARASHEEVVSSLVLLKREEAFHAMAERSIQGRLRATPCLLFSRPSLALVSSQATCAAKEV